MFLLSLVLLSTAVSPPDTVRIDADAALRRAVERSHSLAAARQRAEGAILAAEQARAWSNPQLGFAAENLGAAQRVGGVSSPAELEGQAVISGMLPIGGDRRAAIVRSAAERTLAGATAALAEAEVRFATLQAIAEAERDRRLAEHAAEERTELDRFAATLALGVEQGRFPAGHAARAELAAVHAATEEARRAATAATSVAELGRLLGLQPGTRVRVDAPACAAAVSAPLRAAARLPEEAVTTARLDAADAVIALERARTVPDLHPQVGIRRAGGMSGLYLGFSMDLPAFDRGAAGIGAARAEREAVRAERDDFAARVVAERAAADEALRAFENAGARFDAGWSRAIERSVTASRTAYDLGDGTLTDLLDARRARLAALDDHARWQAEVRTARARAARLAGADLDATLLCRPDHQVLP